MLVKIKKLNENAVIPKYNNPTDAGMDIVATSVCLTPEYIEYGTGLALEIPEGYVGLIFPRSSISKTSMSLCNSVGVIDSGYRGEVKFRFNYKELSKRYDVGDRVGQLLILPYPKVVFEEVFELSDSERGENGFGSSGA